MAYQFTDYGNLVGKRPRAVYWQELQDAVNDLDHRLNLESTAAINVTDYKPATDAISTYPTGITTFGINESVTTGYPALVGVVETTVLDAGHNIQHFFTQPVNDTDAGSTYYRKWNSQTNAWTSWERLVTTDEFNAHTGNTDIHVTALDHMRINGFVYTQAAASTTWVIQHNLQKYPSVSLTDNTGTLMMADVHYDSNNQVTISFSQAVAGTAYLS